MLLSQSSNILAFEKPQGPERQKVYECLRQNYDLDVERDRYVVFPASFRPVKDVEFLLGEFNRLIENER